MADLRITAGLHVEDSADAIKKDLPSLEKKLKEKAPNIKIIAGLDEQETPKLIQASLDKIIKGIKIPTINVGINVSNNNATQNLQNQLQGVQNQANATANSIKSTLADLDAKFSAPIKPVLDTQGLVLAEKTIEKVEKRYKELGEVTVKGIYSDENARDKMEAFTVSIKNATGEIRTLKYELNNGDFYYKEGSYSNSGIQKQIEAQIKLQNQSKATRISMLSDLQQIRAGWENVNGGKSVKDEGNRSQLAQQYVKVVDAIKEMRQADANTMPVMKANVEKQVNVLKQMVAEYHNAEKVATQLRAKDFDTVKIDTENNIDKFIATVQKSKVPIDTIKNDLIELQRAMSMLDFRTGASEKANALTTILNQFDNVKTKFQMLQENFKGLGSSADSAISKLNKLANSNIFRQNTGNSQVQQQASQIQILIGKYQEFQNKLAQTTTPEGFMALQTELEQLKSEFNQVDGTAKTLMETLKSDASTQKLSNNIKILEARIKAFRQANTKAEGKYGNQFDDLLASLKKCADPATYNKINQNFRRMQAEIKAAGLGGMSIIDDLWAKAKKFSQWMGITMITATIAREIRGLFSTVTELDTALVDLRKTFKGTSEDLQEFYYEANNIAKSLGVSTQEVINEAAAFSRLGYSTKEASAEMAKASAMFKLISPGMSAEQATDGIVSMMKAFKIETEDVVDGILSVVNSVGNAFALNNTDIVEAMTRSSAAMAVANNTIEETIALNTAAIEITRDAATSANAIRTASMRLRGYDEETEELSTDVQVLTGKIADLTKTASNPVGISLFTDESRETYKSTYQILEEVAGIWDELTDKNRAELLEAIAGKRSAQTIASILENWSSASDAIKVMEESAGKQNYLCA